jgi:hypothetical protein
MAVHNGIRLRMRRWHVAMWQAEQEEGTHYTVNWTQRRQRSKPYHTNDIVITTYLPHQAPLIDE